MTDSNRTVFSRLAGICLVVVLVLSATSAGATSTVGQHRAAPAGIGHVGPELAPLALWQQVAAPGRSVRGIAHQRSDPNHIYAAAANAGVLQSFDGGVTWSLMPTAGLSDLNLQALAACPSGQVFAGTWGGGVFRSAGSGWVAVNNGLGQLYVAALSCDETGTLLAGTNSAGVFRSTDAGSNWSSSNGGFPGPLPLVLALAPRGGGVVYAGTSVGAFRSTDGGQSWAARGLAGQYVFDFALDSALPSSVWSATSQGVFGSQTDGAAWDPVGSGLSTTYTVARDPAGLLFAGTRASGAYRWNGAQWITEPLSGAIYVLRWAGGAPGRLVAGSADGIWLTQAPGLGVELRSSHRGPVYTGDEITYYIDYQLRGPSKLSGVVVSNAVPVGAEYVPGSMTPATGGTFSNGVVVWTIGDVGPDNPSGTLSYRVRVVVAPPTATATMTTTPAQTPTATATLTATPNPTDTATATSTATSEPGPTGTATATITPTATATPEPTSTPTETPTATLEPTSTPTETPTATLEPTSTPTETPTATPEPTSTPTETPIVPVFSLRMPRPDRLVRWSTAADGPSAVVLVNQGASATWTYGGIDYSARSNSIVHGGQFYLPLIYR